jgi:NDP-4-keto-2,6-dideoxyhexose 3-C-methyltransferase
LLQRCPEITACRVCGNRELVPCLDLGKQYLSSIFPADLNYRGSLQAYPMALTLCAGENACGLVQLVHEFDLSEMYEQYPYQSSTNPSMRRVLQDVANAGIAVGLAPGDVVLDIGCNDATMLSMLAGRGLILAGIDAAQNITQVFSDPDLHIQRGYFSAAKYADFHLPKAKLIFSIAMFYHLSDPVAFSRDVAACLGADGVWIVQMVYMPSMLDTNMYDNIVHEHVGYYDLRSLANVMRRAGLEIFDAELNDVYGGSYRVCIQRAGGPRPTTARVTDLVAAEERAGLGQPATYHAFADRIRRTRDDLRSMLDRLQRASEPVWIYGASTKGNTIAQYCGLTVADTPFAADVNPFKWGKFLIGTDIPIVTEEELHRQAPKWLLALPYSFIDGFLAREAAMVRAGARFILPLPNVTVRPA